MKEKINKEKNKNPKGFILFELYWRVALFLVIFFAILIIFTSEDLESTLIVLVFLAIVGIPTYWFGKKLIEELNKPMKEKIKKNKPFIMNTFGLSRKDDQHIAILIQLLLDKNSGGKLSEWLAEYYLENSDKLTEMYQHHVYTIGAIRKDEREMYINETIGIDFKKELLDEAKYSNHRGQFQSEPVYTSIYSQNNDPIAVSATFSETETPFRSLNQLSVPVTKKKALVSKIISNVIGKPKIIDEDEGLFFWKSDDNVSVLLFPLGHCESRLILFIFDHSKIEKNIMENALKDIGME